jgi:hypothetical protein
MLGAGDCVTGDSRNVPDLAGLGEFAALRRKMWMGRCVNRRPMSATAWVPDSLRRTATERNGTHTCARVCTKLGCHLAAPPSVSEVTCYHCSQSSRRHMDDKLKMSKQLRDPLCEYNPESQSYGGPHD